MRIAALSDVHSNLPALEAVLEDISRLNCDRVIVAGDFLNCGPWPAETLKTLRKLDPVFIKGNHEDYILEHRRNGKTLEPPDRALFAPSRWSLSQLTREDLDWLENLPERAELDGPEGSQVVVVHGSPRRIIEGLKPELKETDLVEIFEGEEREKRLFIGGHSHRPALLHWQGMVIANCGSTGIPLDNDARPCYLLAEWEGVWKVEHRRVEYDREATLKGLERNASYDEGGPFMRLIQRDIEQGFSCGVPAFGSYYRKSGDFPAPPHDFAHLDKAVSRYLNE